MEAEIFGNELMAAIFLRCSSRLMYEARAPIASSR